MTKAIRIVPYQRSDFRLVSRPWPFAQTRRSEIEAHFSAMKRARPGLWNGRVLLACEHSVAHGLCRGSFLETDYASFNAWRDWGYPDATVMDCFASAVLQSSDGAFLLGVMDARTANAGQIYFPAGTPDPGDIVDGRVDLEGNATRELKEETGIDAGELDAAPGSLAVIAGAAIMHARLFRARQTATELRARILRHLASQAQPELADIRMVRSPADLDPMMPPFVTAFLRHMWG